MRIKGDVAAAGSVKFSRERTGEACACAWMAAAGAVWGRTRCVRWCRCGEAGVSRHGLSGPCQGAKTEMGMRPQRRDRNEGEATAPRQRRRRGQAQGEKGRSTCRTQL